MRRHVQYERIHPVKPRERSSEATDPRIAILLGSTEILELAGDKYAEPPDPILWNNNLKLLLLEAKL